MKPKNLLEAITIISANHSNTIIINKSTGNGSTTGDAKNPTLHVKDCSGAALHNLVKAGFSVSMNDGLLSVQDYAKN